MPRPPLTDQRSPTEFARFYWLKEELVAFCRERHLPTGGSKQELMRRISCYLAGEKLPAAPARTPTRTGPMPKTFIRSTIIGPGWRCSQELRAFFECEIGQGFHFDATMRDLIHTGSGKTLQEVMQQWSAVRRDPVVERTIAPQFEYNRHIRDYFKAHPGASLQEAICAWKEKKRDANT